MPNLTRDLRCGRIQRVCYSDYCKKVSLPKKLTLQMTSFSGAAAIFASDLSTALGNWHGNVQFDVKIEIILFFSNEMTRFLQSIFVGRL